MKGFLPSTNRTDNLPGWVMYPALAISVFALGLYGYLGTFSRYGSDDYCLSGFFFLPGDLITLMIERYTFDSSRYTNILFIGLVDKIFGWYNVAILPALMLTLFVWGLYLLLKEVAQTASLPWSRRMVLLISIWVVYFSVLQAPNLYETLYWRAGMTSHFAPLVFLPFWAVFLLRQVRNADGDFPRWWIQVACLLFSYMLGGFSEPPVAIMVTVLALGIAAVWYWGDTGLRRAAFPILGWAFIGSFLALLTLALAPANSIRLKEATPGLFDLVYLTFRYPFDFIVDIIKSSPLPTAVSIILPGLLFHIQSRENESLVVSRRVQLLIFLIAGLVIGYLLIAASFAPSVYGQSYPVARARFAGRVILTGMFMTSGVVMGILSAGVAKTANLRLVFAMAFLIVSFYPLRTSWRVSAKIPIFRQYAEAWDRRDAQIRAMQARGERDLVVPFLPEEPMQDLGDQREFRLNICASRIYGVNSILAIGMDQ